jgi:3-oxoacyl-[acyl-carrier protein] reductase/pteridine reductase
MTARGEGAIINIVDLAAFDPWPNYIAHVVGKSAVLALNRQLALELAPLIRVNAIAPGPVLPPPDFDREDIERGARNTLLNRWGTPDDITRAVIFLLTADYITGEVLLVDGGEHYAHRKVDRR